MEEIKIEIISREIIKPSISTPFDHKLFHLSSLDQTFPSLHLPLLLVYNNNNNNICQHGFKTSNINNNSHIDTIINTLKASLSDTLTQFYPLAGRFRDSDTVSCDDQGVPFSVTRVNSGLSSVIMSRSPDKLIQLSQCLPPDDLKSFKRPISEVVPLAFQVNVFQCGGIVIGCYLIHKLVDAASAATFLTYWAAVATSRQTDVIQPDFHVTVAAFPSNTPRPEKPPRQRNYLAHRAASEPTLVAKSFVFDTRTIKKLKSIGKSEAVPHPTGFETVAGFTWLHAVAAAQNAATTAIGSPSVVIFGVNIRPKIRPPLPRGAMGNLVTNVHARVDDNAATITLPQLVAEIHAAILKANSKAEAMQVVGPEAVAAEGPEWGEIGKEEGGSYRVTSWCKLGLSEVDFGFGKPSRIIPFGMLHFSLKNSIVLVDYNIDDDDDGGDNNNNNNGVGIEVWLFLGEDEMRFLESNPLFCEFACTI